MAEEKIPVQDLSRKYVDEALRYLRLFQSKATKLLYKEPPYQAVSFYENLLFALLLLRKKQHQEMLEGKMLLHKLLGFQSADSFPADLSDYPLCNDKGLPVRISYILEIVVRDFGHILGTELSRKVSSVQEGLRSHLETQIWPKIEAFYADLLLNKPPLCPPEELIADPTCFGLMLAATDYFPDYPWKEFLLEKAFLFWDVDAAMYRGPGCGIFHQGKEQACTLFDCWMSLHTGIPLKRNWTRQSFLELALVSTSYIPQQPKVKAFENEHYAIFPTSQGTFAATFQQVKPHQLRGFSPLRFVCGGITLCWKFPHACLVAFTCQGKRFLGKVRTSERQVPLLFEIFVERSPEVQFPHEETIFNPFQGIEIRLKKTVLKISLEPAAAELVGMLSMGNRASQLFEKQGEEEPFDWIISCEQIRGEKLEYFSFCVEME